MSKKQIIKDTVPIESKTVGDLIANSNEDLYEELIKSGRLFETDIHDWTRYMGDESLKRFFERVDAINEIDLALEYKIKRKKYAPWLKKYTDFRMLLKLRDKRFVNRVTNDQQLILWWYLIKLGVINIDKLPKQDYCKAEVISFLFNCDMHNLKKNLRREYDKEFLTKISSKQNLNKILVLAEDAKFDELKKLVEADLAKLK